MLCVFLKDFSFPWGPAVLLYRVETVLCSLENEVTEYTRRLLWYQLGVALLSLKYCTLFPIKDDSLVYGEI